MARQPVLVAVEGPLKGARYPIEAGGLSLGREDMCEVVIADPNVSRIHARIVLHNSGVWVQDSGSRNGVFINDARVVRHRQFSPGDTMAIGAHRFSLEVEEVHADPTVDMDISESTGFQMPSRRVIAVFCLIVGLGITVVISIFPWLMSQLISG
jgi:pSer/pThr/pTyr-binding forkhead associated (FHA) protein